MPYCDECGAWVNGVDNQAEDPVNDALCIRCVDGDSR